MDETDNASTEVPEEEQDTPINAEEGNEGKEGNENGGDEDKEENGNGGDEDKEENENGGNEDKEEKDEKEGNENSEGLEETAQENKGEGDEKAAKGDENSEDVGNVKDEHFSRNKPNEFSSENFKIELGGLPKYFPLGHLKKLLNNTLQLDAHRVKPGALGRNVAYVNFRDEEARFKAITILNGYKWQGSTLTAEKADPAKDPMLLAKIEFLKVPKKEHEMLPLEERIQKAVTPYHGMPYEEQVQAKEKVVRQVLRKFGNELSQTNPELKKFVHWHKIRRKGQVCEVDDMVQSPVKEGYRNKCEFTIGRNNESEKTVVGFRVASYKEGSVEVGPIHHLRHLNSKMKNVVKLMEKYLDTSKYEPFDPFTHKGVWRQLTVRTTQTEDIMIIVVIHPQEMKEEEIKEIQESVKTFFSEGEGVEAGVTSLYFQQYGQKESGKDIEYEHIYGKTYIEETILGKTFRASPESFLQVNTPACEVLYNKIAEVAEIDATSIVLDVCCGVGTIGLSIAENAYKLMGVELTPKAIEDARVNAELNSVTNAVFYNGRAEQYIDSMIERSQRVNTIAIVDPPRAGLNGSVMNALRKCEYLDKLVYVSCDPQAAINNFQALGRPRSKTYKGSYFVPIRATPVDLFPDTPHFELIVVFERYDECKWDRIMNGNPRPKDQAYFDRVPELKYDYDKDLKEREEKRRQKEKEKEKSSGRRRSWNRGRDDDRRGWNRGGDNYGRRERWGNDNNWGRGGRGGPRGGGGGGPRGDWMGEGGWSGGRGGRRENYDMGRGGRFGGPPAGAGDFRQTYGNGFQEGFQAGLEALGSQVPGGFGQGGGWNMAQTPGGEFGPQGGNGDYDSSPIPKGNLGRPAAGAGAAATAGTWKWDYDGSSGNFSEESPASGGAAPYNPAPPQQQQQVHGFNTQQPVTYPASVTNPMPAATGFGYQNVGWSQNQSGSNWGGNQGNSNQVASNWNQNQYQSFEEPPAKKWKTGAEAGGGYGYSNY